LALLPILKYPDPRLATKAATVTEFDDKLKQLAADMAETMYKAPGGRIPIQKSFLPGPEP